MSRNLGAKNFSGTTLFVSFVENRVKVTIFLVVLCLLLSIVGADKEPQEPSDLSRDPVTEIPDLVKKGLGTDEGAVKDGVEQKTDSTYLSDLGFWHAFLASISVILVSELGDKTFFIAAIMAMRHPRVTVFIGAISALALMTVLSAVFGMAATIIPRVYTYYISTALFAIFGLKMLKEGYYMSPNDAAEELEEVQSDLRKREDEFEKDTTTTLITQDPETGIIRKNKPSASYVLSRIFMQAFTMTFLAEWGDRSQLTTIILAAREDVFGVIVGGVLGHSLCTGLAVIGGRMIAQRISVRTVTIIGGVVFLLFAFSALFFDPNDEKPMKT